MKKKFLITILFAGVFGIFSCKEKPSSNPTESFEAQGSLDSLKSGKIDYGNAEVNNSMIRMLNFQKKFKTGNTNGVVIPKSLLTQSVNGFTEMGINLPTDKSNYDKWDFLVVYPGLAINELGEEQTTPSVFFYKGTKDSKGNLYPDGKPVLNVLFKGGGGSGPGDGAKASPPPTR